MARCPFCHYIAKQKRNLDAHKATHHLTVDQYSTGEKPHVCPTLQCGRAFGDPSALIRHRKAIHKYEAKPRRRNLSGHGFPPYMRHATTSQLEEDLSSLRPDLGSQTCSPSTSTTSLSNTSDFQFLQQPLLGDQPGLISTNQLFPETLYTFSATSVSPHDHSLSASDFSTFAAGGASNLLYDSRSCDGDPSHQPLPQGPFGSFSTHSSTAYPPLQSNGYQGDAVADYFDNMQARGAFECSTEINNYSRNSFEDTYWGPSQGHQHCHFSEHTWPTILPEILTRLRKPKIKVCYRAVAALPLTDKVNLQVYVDEVGVDDCDIKFFMAEAMHNHRDMLSLIRRELDAPQHDVSEKGENEPDDRSRCCNTGTSKSLIITDGPRGGVRVKVEEWIRRRKLTRGPKTTGPRASTSFLSTFSRSSPWIGPFCKEVSNEGVETIRFSVFVATNSFPRTIEFAYATSRGRHRSKIGVDQEPNLHPRFKGLEMLYKRLRLMREVPVLSVAILEDIILAGTMKYMEFRVERFEHWRALQSPFTSVGIAVKPPLFTRLPTMVANPPKQPRGD
ncbi:hypothetical protein CONPUDRAFT_73697 [Coniophora puteana RWD-64-598 SS2]|uniref:C2H2-type domain-containing protein n=1 Tax=Coniophora puteana (strain RWD-64-598) TaxID=741705 RepID=A0A5M3MNI2_CONPW|nr:uncharacterized protein CONPUDRAFT_73697 [Coniophora puteana RWD-64-598 SS2]EIW80607.1 hypothetical protein CONPUDRAFT_73697 [Coniophora puteana RWD-64-598 SS2]